MTDTPVQTPSTELLGNRTTSKTPRIHRLLASAGPKTPHGYKSVTFRYEGLLGKTWRAHALSPMFKFKTSSAALKQYGSSLNVAYSKSILMVENAQQITRSSFEIYYGLSFHSDDPDAIRIQVTERNDEVDSVVLTAMLMCVDIGNGELVDENVSDQFTFYPLLLVSGTKTRAQILLDWLQRHFDTRSSPMEFINADLQWVFALGCRQEGAKQQQVLLQYDVSSLCDGINTVDCKLESPFCKQLWDKYQGDSSSKEFLMENQVCQFVSALEAHLEYTTHIIVSKLSLREVGTPLVYMSNDGKIKLLDPKGVYVILHMICTLITQKLRKRLEGPGFWSP